MDTLRKRVWWPGLTKDVHTFAERCEVCWRRRPNHAQDLQPSELEGVWNKLAVDLVTIDSHTCLSIIDYGSRYPEVIPLDSTTTTAVVDKLMEVFARFGLPAVLVSDNGLQFVSAVMEQFLKQLGVRHVRSSPRYPQSNGMVERLHRVLRQRLEGLRPSIPFGRRLQQVLMDIRNSTNRMLGTTPSEALFQRVISTRIPSYNTPAIVNPAHQIRAKARMASDHDSKRGIHPLPESKTGTVVVLHDGFTVPTKQWRVVEQYRQQVGVTDGKRILLRNRRHVREYHDTAQESQLEPMELLVPDTTRSSDPISKNLMERPLSPSEDAVRLPFGTQPQLGEMLQTDQEPRKEAPAVDATATNKRDNTRAGSTEVKSAGEELSFRALAKSERPSLYKEGTVTRSGRQVKLSRKACEADI